MRRWFYVFLIVLLSTGLALAGNGPSFSGGGGGTSSEVVVDASGFTGNLGVTDTDLQTALDTIDAVALGGDTTETNQDDAWKFAAPGTESGTQSGIDVDYKDTTDDVDFIVDVTPSSGSATLEVAEDAVQVKYDTTLTEGASGLGIIADGVDSAHYAADSIDNEHINWADIDYLSDEGGIVAADESADTSTFVLFTTGATGSQAKTGTNLTFNSSTGALTATSFVGALTGNASGTAATVTGATQASITTLANVTTVGTIGTGVWEATDVAIAHGGTNSSTALNNNFVMISSGGAIVESATVSTTELGLLNGETDLASQSELDAVAALVDTDDEIIAIINASPGTYIDVAAGGTGVGTLADGGLVIGNAGGDVEVVAAGTTSEILVGGGALTAPVWGTDIPTAVTIGSAYIYRVGGTDVADADVVDTLTASNYLPLAGGVLTGEVTVDDLGLQFNEGDTLSDCSTFSATGGGIFYDDSDAKFKKCQDNVLTDLDTDTGGAPALSAVTAPTAAWSIAFDDDEKVTWTTSQVSAGNFIYLDNDTADVTGQVWMLNIDYSVDDNQALADYILLQDAGGTVLTIEEGGKLSIGADPGDGGIFNLDNAAVISWEDATETTLTHVDNTGLDVNLNLTAGTLTSDATVTAGTDVIIGDAGNIGSASDTDSIAIAADGKVTFSQDVIISGTGIELNHATANTLTASSGDVSIEGNIIYRAGGTDVPDGDVADNITITAGSQIASGSPTFTAVTVDTEVYGAGWNADNSVPTKDAVYDKIEASTGDVISVGDCSTGACLDGTSDGGTTISLYDGDSHKLTIDAADLTGDATLVIGSDTNNITLVNGTASIDIAAAATLNIDKGLTVGTNAGTLNFTAASKTLSVEDTAVVSQDYSSDASPSFAGLTLANAGVITFTDAVATTITHVDNTGLVINTELEVDGTFDADGQVELGDGGDTVAINSSDWDIDATGAISNASIDDDNNVISNIVDGSIKAGAEIDATKIADGSVDSTEFQYLNGLSADLATSLATGTVTVSTLLDVNEDVDIDFNAADEEVNITNSAEYGADGAQVTIANTDADVGAAMYLLRLRYTDNGQANADFAVFEDNNGDDMIAFTDGGAITAAGAIQGGTITDGTMTSTSGAVTGVTNIESNLYDVNGAADLDIGSADVLDVTIVENGGTYIFDNGLSAAGEDLGSATAEWGDLYIADDKDVKLGSNQDWDILYDETTNDRLEFTYNNPGTANTAEVYFEMTDAAADSTFTISNSDATYEANMVVEGEVTASKLNQDAADGSFWYFDPETANESEWWIGTNHDSVGDDNDAWEIRQSAPPGSSVRVSVAASTGNVAIAGDLTVTGDDLVMTTNTSGALLIADGTNFNPTAVGGDATLASNGALSVSDLTIASEARGSLLTFNPGGAGGWEVLTTGTSGKYLTTDGTDLSWADVTATASDCTPDGGVQYEVGGAFACEAAFYYTQGSNILTVDAIGVSTEEVVIFADVASALNEITITNAATTDKPSIIPSGETNVGLIIDMKGTGELILGSADAKFSLVSDALDISNAGAISNATTISGSGDITTTEDLVVGDAKYIGSTSDKLAIQIEADGDIVLTDDITVGGGDLVIANGGTITFTDGASDTIAHTDDTGIAMVSASGTVTIESVVFTDGAISSATTLGMAGALSGATTVGLSHTAPAITLEDSDDEAGTGSILFATANATRDVVATLQVEVNNDPVTFLTLDGTNEYITFGKYINGIELDHATANTLSASGGVLSIEGDALAEAAQTFYIGTTQVAINRASAGLTLAGITLTTPVIGAATGTSLDVSGDVAGSTVTIDNGGTITFTDGASDTITHTNDTGIAMVSESGTVTIESVVFTGGALSSATTFNGSGDITTTEDLVIGDAKYIGSTTDKLAMQIEADGDIVLTDDLAVNGDDITADGALTITAPTITLDADGTNDMDVVLKVDDNGTDWSVTIDGSEGQVVIGDGDDIDHSIKIDSDTNYFTMNWDEDNAELELTSEGDETLVIDLDHTTDQYIGIDGSGSGATHIDFAAMNLVTTGSISGALNVIADSDGHTLTTAQGYGFFYINTGASGGTTVTLPDAVVGMNGCVVLDTADDVNIQPNGSERILVDTDTNGDYISSDMTIGSYYCVVAVSATQWMPMGQAGTWTEE